MPCFALTLPYFWAISDNKDLTFTPKFYTGTNALYSTEYRQETENTSLILDTSYSRGYKKVGGQKNLGPRNHLFGKWNVDLDIDGLDESNIDFNFQRVSNDTYLRVHEINTAKETGLVDHQESTLLNEIDLNLEKDDEILSTNHEYGAMIRAWEWFSENKGYSLIQKTLEVPFTTTNNFVDDFWSAVTNNTKIIFISHITSPTAIIFPIEEICQQARNKSIMTIIDGAHVPGHIQLDISTLDPDIYIGCLLYTSDAADE